MQDKVEHEKDQLQLVRLHLAKKNRAIVSIERKLDNIPDRTELSQYQRRFVELYSQGKVKHLHRKFDLKKETSTAIILIFFYIQFFFQ